MSDKRKMVEIIPNAKLQGVINRLNDKRYNEAMNVGEYIDDKSRLFGINRNVARDLPSIIDGLTPVERRMLYTMFYHGHLPNSNPVKVATIVGQCIELVYPHGDGPLNQTNARLGRDWNMMIPYIKGEGNFGDIYTKKEASMRYRKAKLSEYAYDCFFSETSKSYYNFDTRDNYNYSDEEPIWLPTKYPNILAQWNLGISVGASSTIGAFNFEELCKATIKLIDDPKAKINIYPDTPMPLYITNKDKVTGCFDKNNFTMNTVAPYDIVYEKGSNKEDLVYIVFKSVAINANLMSIEENIKQLKQEDTKKGSKNLKEIKDMRIDVAGKDGKSLNFYIQIEKGYNPDEVAKKILSLTKLSSSIHIAYNVVKDHKIVKYTPRTLLLEWIENRIMQKFRIIQRDIYRFAYERMIASGLVKVKKSKGGIDKLIDIIRNYKKDGRKATNAEIVEKVMKEFDLYPKQAQYIVESKLVSLSSLSLDELDKTIKKAEENHAKAVSICNEKAITEIIKEELKEGIKKYGAPRNLLFKNPVNNVESKIYHVFYNDKGFYSSQQINSKKPEIDRSYKYIEIISDEDYMVFYRNGAMLLVNGGAFEAGEIPGSKEALLTNQSSRFKIDGVIRVLPVKDDIEEILVVTKRGVCKRVEYKAIMGKTGCNIMPSDTDDVVDILAITKDNKESSLVLIDRGTNANFTHITNIPLLGRNSKGKQLMRNKSQSIEGADLIDKKSTHVLLIADNGTCKVLKNSFIKYDSVNAIVMPDRNIRQVIGLTSDIEFKMFSDKVDSVSIKMEKDGLAITYKDESTKLKYSTTVGVGTKVFRKSKNDYYELK